MALQWTQSSDISFQSSIPFPLDTWPVMGFLHRTVLLHFIFLRSVHTVSHNGCSGQRVLIFMNVTIWRRGENIFLSWCFSDWVGKEQEMGLCVLSLSHLLAHSYFRKTWKIIGSYSVGCLCCPARLHRVLSINTVVMFTHSCGELPVPARLSGISVEGAEFWLCDIYVLD